ncbi:unnamed protein product [Dovyalis caffra]|uniref:Profilin n=1 Tax=Dovyalis caffra TaxID=77055 RepID=A0AAV1SKD5_9ROSI|nr:unnamed protein product [Dovyalis caffra]
MSWQTYVDEHLMCDIDGHTLTSAAIIGQDGSVWAQSASFPQFTQEEVNAIMKDFDEPGSLAPTGLYLGGTKYMVIQGEPGAVIRGKKGSGGVTIKKTSQALVIGVYDEPLTPGQCNMIVERLGDYLVDQGLYFGGLHVPTRSWNFLQLLVFKVEDVSGSNGSTKLWLVFSRCKEMHCRDRKGAPSHGSLDTIPCALVIWLVGGNALQRPKSAPSHGSLDVVPCALLIRLLGAKLEGNRSNDIVPGALVVWLGPCFRGASISSMIYEAHLSSIERTINTVKIGRLHPAAYI